MYAKVFRSLFDGSLRGKSDPILVFVNLLVNCDEEGFVDRHFKAISEETGLPLDRVEKAIFELELPDPESRSQDLEGRRLERLDPHRSWGWRIVNHGKYRSLQKEADRREQLRLAQQRFRAKNKPTLITDDYARLSSASVSESDSVGKEECEKEGAFVTSGNASVTPAVNLPTDAQAAKWLEDTQSNGSDYTTDEMRFALAALRANGGKWGRNHVVDWRAALERQIGSDRQHVAKSSPPEPKYVMNAI